jgi:hypothetical protein
MSQVGRPDIAYWTGPGGDHWARHHDVTERMFAPVTAALLAATNVRTGERILDAGS